MALLFMDSFNHYATADLTEKWSSTTATGGGVVTIQASAGRRSSAALRANGTSGSNAYATKILSPPPSGTTAVVGLAVQFTSLPSTVSSFLAVADGANWQVYASVLSDGRIQVQRGVSNTVLGTTGSAVLTAGSYTYLEFQVLISATVGTIALVANGASVLSVTGLNTNPYSTTWSSVIVGYLGNQGRIIDIDDLYVCDGTGAAPWNGFLGDCRVDARYPTAEGASAAWTPLSGTDNALMVDESAPDDDTTYNSTSTTGATDTHVCQDAPVVGATLYGVQHCLSMKAVAVGVCSVAPVTRHSGVDYPGAAITPGTSYGYGLQIAQTNPGTGAAWTEAGFNAAEFGYVRTA